MLTHRSFPVILFVKKCLQTVFLHGREEGAVLKALEHLGKLQATHKTPRAQIGFPNTV